MKTAPANLPGLVLRAAFYEPAPLSFAAWKLRVERAIVGLGLRAKLLHIEPEVWLMQYRGGVAPEDAVDAMSERLD